MDKPTNIALLGGGLLFLFLTGVLVLTTTSTPKSEQIVAETPISIPRPAEVPVPTAQTNANAVKENPVQEQPVPPQPDELKVFVPEQIEAADKAPGGYIVHTTFGKNWFFSEELVSKLPGSMQLRIDYGKYGTGASKQYTERTNP